MAEAEFLRHLAEALGRPTPPKPAPLPDYRLPPRAVDSLDEAQRLDAFVLAFEAVNGRFFRAHDWDEATGIVRALLDELAIDEGQAAVWTGPELEPLRRAFPDLYSGGEATGIARRELGITWAHAAIAETGTLALMAGPGNGRATSVLPPAHLAIFSKNELVGTMGEVFERLGDQPFRALNFITGPSRTSDIEMDLTIGVHGPAQVIALYLETR
ncbi:hypothetical protein GTO89_09810 [Heliobacterium gestii]|uniref:LUD domain-containing protein n=1 Tax=Heliomicrobium gestii TaxID=2699 RepID=A0A845LD83_HELGE|nr:lactate utilization protein [Heliomicrobium gestii]MBM7867854.1 L-lactate dehydrogenase complex protein LldG [Heliomicrobium gestii]MZP43334.1 hypothetical protein [Heliomicrobium gestii]